MQEGGGGKGRGRGWRAKRRNAPGHKAVGCRLQECNKTIHTQPERHQNYPLGCLLYSANESGLRSVLVEENVLHPLHAVARSWHTWFQNGR